MRSMILIHSVQSKWKLCNRSRIFVRRRKALIEMQYLKICLTLFRMGFFGAAHGWRGPKRPPLPKICPTYPAMMKLGTVISYPKKIQKYMNHVAQLLSSAGISIFSSEISKFCYIKKYRYRLHIDCISSYFF